MKHLMAIAGLIEEAGLGTSGIDLYIGTIPAEIRTGVMLRDPLVGAEIDKGMKNFYAFEISVIIRDPDVEAGYQKALQLQSELDLVGWENDEIFISWLTPCDRPVSYPRGDNDNLETSFRLRIGYGEKL